MMNRPIEGVVVQARLRSSGFGQRSYQDVVLRRRDGREQTLGRLTASQQLADALVPGREGRFYFHDIMGSQGLHGYQPVGGELRIAFPTLVEHVFALLALINLTITAYWLSAAGGLQIVPLMLGVVAVAAYATTRGCREAVLHDLRFESRVAAARTYREAVMRSHA